MKPNLSKIRSNMPYILFPPPHHIAVFHTIIYNVIIPNTCRMQEFPKGGVSIESFIL